MASLKLQASYRWWFVPLLLTINLANFGLLFRDGPPWVPSWLVRRGVKLEVSNG